MISKNAKFAGQLKIWTLSQKTGVTNQGGGELVMLAPIKRKDCITVLIRKKRRREKPDGSPRSKVMICQTHDCNEEALHRAFGGDVE